MFQISVGFDLLSIFLVAFVLALSVIPSKTKVSVGPKIIAVNLLLFNFSYSLLALFDDVRPLNEESSSFIWDNASCHRTIPGYLMSSLLAFRYLKAEYLRLLILLVFCSSYVPILGMFIMACFIVDEAPRALSRHPVGYLKLS